MKCGTRRDGAVRDDIVGGWWVVEVVDDGCGGDGGGLVWVVGWCGWQVRMCDGGGDCGSHALQCDWVGAGTTFESREDFSAAFLSNSSMFAAMSLRIINSEVCVSCNEWLKCVSFDGAVSTVQYWVSTSGGGVRGVWASTVRHVCACVMYVLDGGDRARYEVT